MIYNNTSQNNEMQSFTIKTDYDDFEKNKEIMSDFINKYKNKNINVEIIISNETKSFTIKQTYKSSTKCVINIISKNDNLYQNAFEDMEKNQLMLNKFKKYVAPILKFIGLTI